MASAELVQQLEEQLETINRYQDTELVSRRDDWGAITFEIASQDIETAKSIAADLSSMPLRYLTDQAVNDIMGHVPTVSAYLQQIDEFKLKRRPGTKPKQHRFPSQERCRAASYGSEPVDSVSRLQAG